MTGALGWLVIGWLALLGGVFGSFMNVVVYRMPRGMSLSRPGSHCPKCRRAVRWHDNMPVVGWLLLRGRCRDCGAAISARYPLIEALVALVSALLAWSEIEPLAPELGEGFVLHVGPFALRLWVLCTLICAALIEWDGHRAPLKLLGWGVTVGLAMALVWQGARESLLGLAGALLMGLLAWPGWIDPRTARPVVRAMTYLAELALAGLLLEVKMIWPATALGMFVYALLQGASLVWPAAGRIGWGGVLVVVAVVASPALTLARMDRIGQNELAVPIASGVVVAVLAVGLHFLRTSKLFTTTESR